MRREAVGHVGDKRALGPVRSREVAIWSTRSSTSFGPSALISLSAVGLVEMLPMALASVDTFVSQTRPCSIGRCATTRAVGGCPAIGAAGLVSANVDLSLSAGWP